MFSAKSHSLQPKGEQTSSLFFQKWFEKQTAHFAGEEAKTVWKKFLQHEAFQAFTTTPQSPRWHSEGTTLDAHILRMMTTFYAIRDGASIEGIEEVARRKEYRRAFLEVQTMIREKSDLVLAFILLHDIAKPATVSFSAVDGSLGAKEGFVLHKHRSSLYATQEELRHYDKLKRAFAIQKNIEDEALLAAKFFDAYEISVHYKDHAEKALEEDFVKAFSFVQHHLALTEEEMEVVTFLVRYHMEYAAHFTNGVDELIYKALLDQWKREGKEKYFMQTATLMMLFFDGFAGCLSYEEGNFFSEDHTMYAYLQSEDRVDSSRREEWKRQEEQEAEEAFSQLLVKMKLGSEDVFTLLDVPFGPERKQLILEVRSSVKTGKIQLSKDFQHSELEKRIQKAMEAYKEI